MTPRPLTGPSSFLPREWDDFFAELSPDERREAAVRLCREVVTEAQLGSPAVDQAVAALADTDREGRHLHGVQSLLDRLEAEYEALVGEDEGKLSCADPQIEAAFVNARAASAVQFALEGKLREMAYEAWCVLNDQNLVRRLVGMPPADPEPVAPAGAVIPHRARAEWSKSHVIPERLFLWGLVVGVIPGVAIAAWYGWGPRGIQVAALISAVITLGLVALLDRLLVRRRKRSPDSGTAE